MRPSCAATTSAFGELIRSTNWTGCGLPLARAADAAAAGEGAALLAPGADAVFAVVAALAEPLSALAPAVAVEVGAGALDPEADGAPHVTCLPATGSSPSVRPVSVAITLFG